MAKIPNPVWAYPDVEGAPGGILIPAPVIPPPEPDPVVVEPPE